MSYASLDRLWEPLKGNLCRAIAEPSALLEVFILKMIGTNLAHPKPGGISVYIYIPCYNF
jgi:hypothetical protein